MNIIEHIKPEQFNALNEIHAKLNSINASISDIDAAINKNNLIIADNATPIDNASTLRADYHQAAAHAELGIISIDDVNNHHADMKSAELLDDQHNEARVDITKKANAALLGLNTLKNDQEKIAETIKAELKACKMATLIKIIKTQSLDYERKALETIESYKTLGALENLVPLFSDNKQSSSGTIPWEGGKISLPAVNMGNQKRQKSTLNRFNDALLIGIEMNWLLSDDSVTALTASISELFSNPFSEVK